MYVLICTGIFPPETGGPATYSYTLAQELLKRGNEVTVVTYSHPELDSGSMDSDFRQNDKFRLIRITRSFFKPWHYYKYFRAVKKYGREADVLYAQDPVSAGYPTYLAARVLKKPYVVKITSDYAWDQARNRGLSSQSLEEFQTAATHPRIIERMRDIQFRVCREACAVITPSQSLRQLVLGWSVKEKRTHVVHNSVSLPPMPPKTEARDRLGLQPGDFLVLSIGRDIPGKGFAVLRQTVANIQKTRPEVKLAILTQANRETVVTHLSAADIFALNTAYEGLSHTILEALAAGLPVITTNVGGNSEIIEPGQNGVFVRFNDQNELREVILRLCQDTALRQRLAEGAREVVKRFDVSIMISKTLEVLQQCAS